MLEFGDCRDIRGKFVAGRHTNGHLEDDLEYGGLVLCWSSRGAMYIIYIFEGVQSTFLSPGSHTVVTTGAMLPEVYVP
jgi:hypothetical protein